MGTDIYTGSSDALRAARFDRCGTSGRTHSYSATACQLRSGAHDNQGHPVFDELYVRREPDRRAVSEAESAAGSVVAYLGRISADQLE